MRRLDTSIQHGNDSAGASTTDTTRHPSAIPDCIRTDEHRAAVRCDVLKTFLFDSFNTRKPAKDRSFSGGKSRSYSAVGNEKVMSHSRGAANRMSNRVDMGRLLSHQFLTAGLRQRGVSIEPLAARAPLTFQKAWLGEFNQINISPILIGCTDRGRAGSCITERVTGRCRLRRSRRRFCCPLGLAEDSARTANPDYRKKKTCGKQNQPEQNAWIKKSRM